MRRLDSNQRFPAYETGNLTACLLRNIDEVLLRPPHRRSLAYHIWMDAYGEMQANIYVFLNILEGILDPDMSGAGCTSGPVFFGF